MNAQLVDVQIATLTADGKLIPPRNTPDHPAVTVLVLTDPIEQHGVQGWLREHDEVAEEATWEDVEWQ